MRQLPAGTVTFLFTDIEGPTRLVQEQGAGFQTLLETHSELIRGATSESGGVEIRTEGDSFFVVFSSAPDAVRAAVIAQRALTGYEWPAASEVRVRMGLHTGEGTVGGDDYVGLDVHRAARLADAAHGGQIVISESTRVLMPVGLSLDESFLDLGVHMFKDLQQPERVYQVIHPDLPTEFPPLRSLDGFPNNLPAQLSSFLGREETLRAAQKAIGDARLVTLMGPGGVGKTRLALQVAASQIETHPDGVWLAELGGLSDPDLVPEIVHSALGAPQHPGQSALEILSSYLKRKELLLVLDNCEHLIDAAADLSHKVLATSPQVRILATSREPLGVTGEVSYPVQPMAITESDSVVRVNDPPESVRLFVERAKAVDPQFELTERNLAAVAAICRSLDGLPLGIELAAARVRALSVDDIANRLKDHLMVLSTRTRGVDPRQQTLKAAVAWSYELLDAQEQSLFTRLGLFAGPFDLAGAEKVGSGDDIERQQVVDLLSDLVNKSLLVVIRDDEEVRYRMLTTIRDYALSQLTEGPEMIRLEDAHTHWALGFAEDASNQLVGPQARIWIGRIRTFLDDLRAVMERCVQRRTPEPGLQLLTSLQIFFILTEVREGTYWIERLLDAGDASPEVLALALSLRGDLFIFQDKVTEAVSVLEQSLELFETLDDPLGRAWSQHRLGIALWEAENPERARQLLTPALKTFQEVKDAMGIIRSLFVLALWEFAFGDPAAAADFASQIERLGEKTGAALVKDHAAEVHALGAHFANTPEQAQIRFVEAVGHYKNAGTVQCLAHCMEHIALWALSAGLPERAASLLGAAVSIRDDHVGTSVPPFERIWSDQAKTTTKEQLSPSAFERHFQEGRQASPEDALELASAALILDGNG